MVLGDLCERDTGNTPHGVTTHRLRNDLSEELHCPETQAEKRFAWIWGLTIDDKTGSSICWKTRMPSEIPGNKFSHTCPMVNLPVSVPGLQVTTVLPVMLIVTWSC